MNFGSLLTRAVGRRNVLKAGLGLGVLSPLAGAVGCAPATYAAKPEHGGSVHGQEGSHHATGGHLPGGAYNVKTNDFDPMKFLFNFDRGKETKEANGTTTREYEFVAKDKQIEIAPGVMFSAWTYNGQVPGPTIRVTEGDRVVLKFMNEGVHPHSIHFHGIHPSNMDGVFEQIAPGQSFTYDFVAHPHGLFLYHCHTMPIKRHLHKGLYGAFIVDPKDSPWQPAKEMVMIMNAFDTDFDGENEFYAVNSLANYHIAYPIEIQQGELVRIYLVNLTEFDPINSFHIHGNVFKLYRTGTRPDHYEITDLVTLCQAERCILEFKYDMPGMFMFHAHQSEFAELGWNGFFKVVPKAAFAPASTSGLGVCPLPTEGIAANSANDRA